MECPMCGGFGISCTCRIRRDGQFGQSFPNVGLFNVASKFACHETLDSFLQAGESGNQNKTIDSVSLYRFDD